MPLRGRDAANIAAPLAQNVIRNRYMNDVNKKLDDLLRKEGHKKFRLYSILFALLVITTMGVIAYSTGESISIKAEVTALHSQASEELGERFYIIVNLESGRVVKLEVPREIGVKKGDTVLLNERKTNLFGLLNYSFQRVSS